MRGVVALGLVVGVLLGPAACAEPEVASESAVITAAELQSRIARKQAPFVLDVRTPAEFAKGHVPGAVNIPHSELSSRLSELTVAPEEELVVMCESGKRAGIAEALLRERGYTRVRDLEGHMKGWRSGKLPTQPAAE